MKKPSTKPQIANLPPSLCPQGQLYFAPEDRCVPKMTSPPRSKEETVTYGVGAVILGALGGFILGRKQDEDEEEFAEEMEWESIIAEYDLKDFVPNIDDIDFDHLTEEECDIVNYYILLGTVSRLEKVEDDYDYDRIFEDLSELEILIDEKSYVDGMDDDAHPILEFIDYLQEVLSFAWSRDWGIDDVLLTFNELIEMMENNEVKDHHRGRSHSRVRKNGK